ncbi:hypothetical protein M409DRAFT_61513 [Zasmidium cellare ATCC 36951]|uniref:Uncharacterized protein n=1 Tax=Zasmidium cellare ATCC 36951 TaxID=1080233 RepID=A0A6A6BYI3_ZASCE|nr:uncharacterized protein M409DRAFT_61513 [Zasmidium cellare ATCC 36951]KAF2158622.1 hypothetical protein M409DRAFT_61513 [Zasmidium cellare ATCC 36951]
MATLLGLWCIDLLADICLGFVDWNVNYLTSHDSVLNDERFEVVHESQFDGKDEVTQTPAAIAVTRGCCGTAPHFTNHQSTFATLVHLATLREHTQMPPKPPHAHKISKPLLWLFGAGLIIGPIALELGIDYIWGRVQRRLNDNRAYPSGGYHQHMWRGLEKMKEVYPNCAVLPQMTDREPNPRAWVEKFNFVVDCRKIPAMSRYSGVKRFWRGRIVDEQPAPNSRNSPGPHEMPDSQVSTTITITGRVNEASLSPDLVKVLRKYSHCTVYPLELRKEDDGSFWATVKQSHYFVECPGTKPGLKMVTKEGSVVDVKTERP